MSEFARKKSAMEWLRKRGVEYKSVTLRKFFDCTYDVIINMKDGSTQFRRLRILPSGFLGGCVEV